MLQNETFFNACRFLGSSITNLKFSLVIFCASLSLSLSSSEWREREGKRTYTRQSFTKGPNASQQSKMLKKTYSTHNQADKLKTKQEDDNE